VSRSGSPGRAASALSGEQPPPAQSLAIDEETAMTITRPAPRQKTDFATAVERLSKVSVDRHFDAYLDVAWDDPDMAIDPGDPRFELWLDDPLRQTDWYSTQPPEIRSRVALHRVATAMRIGWEFENVLQRGLLEHVYWMDGREPELRYLMHEIAEECQHMLMFQEFANRSGLDIHGMPRHMKHASRMVVLLSQTFPAAFFMFVLAGEDPVDFIQRKQLKEGGSHPAAERIMRIHVTEEARHIAFARHYLRRQVPRLNWFRRRQLALMSPIIFGTMARLMAFPSPHTARSFGVPRKDLRRALRSAKGRRLLREVAAGPRKFCVELGLARFPYSLLWRLMGVWDDASVGAAIAEVDQGRENAAA
jgi:P-aminobenzoate N-oxygenase AurF